MIENSPMFLEDSGIEAFELDANLTPDNVLIAPLGKLKMAFLIGIEHDNRKYLATNADNPNELIPYLKEALRDMIARSEHEERIHD